jgi:hypothetical protein
VLLHSALTDNKLSIYGRSLSPPFEIARVQRAIINEEAEKRIG